MVDGQSWPTKHYIFEWGLCYVKEFDITTSRPDQILLPECRTWSIGPWFDDVSTVWRFAQLRVVQYPTVEMVITKARSFFRLPDIFLRIVK